MRFAKHTVTRRECGIILSGKSCSTHSGDPIEAAQPLQYVNTELV
uniref:Uncharacterized protein n=1 Tax=Setaria digitata TaxID=48799 RepID=A0A915PSK3_9BILA